MSKSTSAAIPAADPPRSPWQPLPTVWGQFAKAYPELFVGEAASTRSRFCSRHGPALIAAGALTKTPGGAYYARPEKFLPLAWSLTMGLPVEVSA